MKETKQLYKSNRTCQKFLLLIIVHCSLLIGNCFTQSITWQRTYNSQYNDDDYGEDICEANDENFYIVGASTLPNMSNDTYLLKINKYGDTLWTRHIANAWAKSVARTIDSGCVITGYANLPYTMKYSKDGVLIWHKVYGAGNVTYWGRDIICTNDSSYIIVGTINYYTGYIAKIDSEGNLQWEKLYSNAYGKYLNKIEHSLYSGYLVAGNIRISQSDTGRGLIMNIDSIGNTIWEKYVTINGHTGIFGLQKFDDFFLVSGQAYIGDIMRIFYSKIDQYGSEVFTKVIYSNRPEYGGKLKVKTRNRYVMICARDTVINGGAKVYSRIYVTDSLGNTIYSKDYFATGSLEIASHMILQNGDIVFIGRAEYPLISDVYALRTDSFLIAPAPIGLNEIELNVPSTFKLFNYPNPFNSSTKIIYDIPLKAVIELKVLDITGKSKLIRNASLHLPGKYEFNFNSHSLSSGIYFVVLFSNGTLVQYKKIALIK